MFFKSAASALKTGWFFLIVLLFFVITGTVALAQVFTQVVRGTIHDKASQETLIGAVVLLVDSTMTNGTNTDVNGIFRMSKVPLGRQMLKVSFVGYKEITIPVVVTSGKEVVLNIELEQSVIEGKEVVVVAERRKDKPNNEMTTVSARSFTVDETSRYAGSLLDPARMAMNYAGVSGANDARNDIIIRGNSPLGVLWRLNGIDIPNPNHFGSLGVTGGPISILNNNSLDQSDFLTGAFPAEYGNAIAGAFDLQMRSGNNEKHEFLGQVGFNGFEFGAEGPFKKGNSSYMMNYRYSTLGVFKSLGMNLGTGAAVPQYQDLTFKADFPTQKAGKLSLFGIGGISYIEVLDKDRDTTQDNIYNGIQFRQDGNFGTGMGVIGLSHLYFISNNTYTKLTLAASTTGQDYKIDSIDVPHQNKPIAWYRNHSNQQKYSVNFSFNKKFSARDYLKAGFTVDHLVFAYNDSLLSTNGIFKTITKSDGSSSLLQGYVEWQHKFSDKLSINSGIHSMLFTLNHTGAVEPRFGIRWEMNEGQSISFGTGIHSQLQPLYTYFQKTLLLNGLAETNHHLEMTSANHFVLAYDQSFSKNIRLKMETYYQYLYRVPVEHRPTFYSILNDGADFGVSGIDSLENNGTGKNYGAEITLEKFYSKGFYFLITGSFFESKYRGSDGIERNTVFNGNYTVNVLAGKEWTINRKNVLGINLRTVASGGKRYLPIDFVASQQAGETKYDEMHAYEKRQKDYFRTDIRISYRVNKKHVTHEFALDVDNIFNTKNIWQQVYDPKTNSVKTEYQIGLFPVPLYRLTF
ncbi:MAG: TonB-dependent receptor [Bacteroidetes bacterium]|nr:TonB-dependent receptor [Bacteroidota bacterium]